MNRRNFMEAAGGVLAAAIGSEVRAAGRGPRILLRSSWQILNIGDIGHTPGVLALLEKHIPNSEAILWASSDLSLQVASMLRRRFPRLRVVKGTIGKDGRASNPELEEAVDWADFLLHGSGPSLVGAKDAAAFVKHTHKPFGVYGITHGSFPEGPEGDAALLGKARFVYFRDSVSLQAARDAGVDCPVMEFAPDGAFACDLRDDPRADTFLLENGLEPGKFLCCLSRLRYTPYWLIPAKRQPFNEERHARNEAMKEHDHLPLREAIMAVVQNTGLKVLLCPEDVTQVPLGKEMLYDPLPDDVKKKVVWRDRFWLTDEAVSTYLRSAGVFGSEMHSPIMALGNGIPAIVCRFEEQTSKGLMWKDIGLGDWLFDLDVEDDRKRIVPAVLEMARSLDAAREKIAPARALVQQRQSDTMAQLRRYLPAT